MSKPNRKKLTQNLCEKMAPPAEGYLTVWDSGLPGFGLRISSKGRRSWIAMYRVTGQEKPEVMETIGPMTVYPLLAEAKNRARQSMDLARQGIHPVKMRKRHLEAEEAAAAADAFKLEQLADRFLAEHHLHSRPATKYETRRLLRRALPYLGHLPIKQISKADILAMTNDLRGQRLHPYQGRSGGALSECSSILRCLRTCLTARC